MAKDFGSCSCALINIWNATVILCMSLPLQQQFAIPSCLDCLWGVLFFLFPFVFPSIAIITGINNTNIIFIFVLDYLLLKEVVAGQMRNKE